MSYPRASLDLNMLILEKRSCEAMAYASRRKDPTWKFATFEALHFGNLKQDPVEERYTVSQVLGLAEPYFEELDKKVPVCLPMEKGTHYLWELFGELPRGGESMSTRQFWNRLSRALSEHKLPMTVDEFVAAYSEAAQKLLSKATDMGDRFYLSELDFGGWSGGIVSKDFLVLGMDMIAQKLNGPLLAVEPKKQEETEKDEAEGESVSEKTRDEKTETTFDREAFSAHGSAKRKRPRKNTSRRLWLQVEHDRIGAGVL